MGSELSSEQCECRRRTSFLPISQNQKQLEIKVHDSPNIKQIEADDPPKYHWISAQCREWLQAVLITTCGTSKEYAIKKNTPLQRDRINLVGFHCYYVAG